MSPLAADLARVLIRTPFPESTLRMRVAIEADLVPLARLAAGGVDGGSEVPADQSWYGRPVDGDFEPVFIAAHRAMLESLGRPGWTVPLVVVNDACPEELIGVQYLADDTLSGTVATSAWVGAAHHGKGFERQMRGIALDLAVTCIGVEKVRSYVFARNAMALDLADQFCYEDPGTTAIRTVGTRLREFTVLELHADRYCVWAPWTTSSMLGREALAAALPTPGAIDLRSGSSALVRS